MIKVLCIIVAGVVGLWCVAWGFLGLCVLINVLQDAKKEAEEFRKWDR